MRRKLFVWALCLGTSAMAQTPPPFEVAVACIKHFEGWHTERNHPYVGYGHKLRGKAIPSRLTEAQADSLLRADLRQKCAVFRRFGIDSVLLGTLAYNVGEYTLLGYGNHLKSRLIRKLEAGDRNIREEYLSYRMWRGKVVKSLEERRRSEFELLFIKSNTQEDETKHIYKDCGFAGTVANETGRTGRPAWAGGGRPCFGGTPGQGIYGITGGRLSGRIPMVYP